MGLKITSAMHTNKGNTSEMYLNLNGVMVNKMGMNNATINRFVSKAVRDANERDTCDCFEVPNNFKLDLTVQELAAANIYTVVYGKISDQLTTAGFTVETL